VSGIEAARNCRLFPAGWRIRGARLARMPPVVFANLARFRMIERNG